MNRYNLQNHLQRELDPFKSSLKATSFDDSNQEYLCSDESLPDVYDFDKYVRCHHTHPTPASPDAIHIGQKKFYFIEFKNQAVGNIDKVQMKRKFNDGTNILKNLLQDFSPRDNEYSFCVVLKEQPRPRYMDSRHIENTSLKFKIEEWNEELDRFYDHIVVESVESYINNFDALRCN